MTRGRGNGVTPPRVVELLRKEVSGKSILAVSNATGLGLAAIGRYLKGVGEPTNASLQKLADYFGETFIIEIKPRGKNDGTFNTS
jgi:transcriptional regulator with XRE-family HTH domain